MKNRWSRETAAIRELCALGLPAQTLVPAVLEALHRVVPSSRNLFDWTDESGRLIHYYFEGPIDTRIAQLYFAEFHNHREAEAMPRFDALAQRPAGIHSAAELDHAGFFGSALFNEIWRPQGLKYRVEAVLRAPGGRLVGSLVLYREPGDRCFSADEERRLAQVVPVLSAGLARSHTAAQHERHVPAAEPVQSLLLDLDGTVQHASTGAERWLLLACGGISRSNLAQPLDWLARTALSPLLQRLREQATVGSQQSQAGRAGLRTHQAHQAHQRDKPDKPDKAAELNFGNLWGQFKARAQLLLPRGAGQRMLVQVTLERQEPYRVALSRALQRLPLTAGQAAVCSALVQGHTQAQIALQLGVAPATVIDHVRKSYRALDVRSVLELRAVVDERMI